MESRLQNIFVLIVAFISYSVSISTEDEKIWRLTNLNLIITSDVLEQHEVSVRKASLSGESKDPKENQNIKKKICQSICTIRYFEDLGIGWFDIDRKVERETLDNLYSTKDEFSSILEKANRRYNYKNGYEIIGRYRHPLVHIDEHPMVSSCLVWQWPSDVGEVFVSQPYFATIPDLKIVNLPGRFVFLMGEKDLSLLAFATDPTKARPPYYNDE